MLKNLFLGLISATLGVKSRQSGE